MSDCRIVSNINIMCIRCSDLNINVVNEEDGGHGTGFYGGFLE